MGVVVKHSMRAPFNLFVLNDKDEEWNKSLFLHYHGYTLSLKDWFLKKGNVWDINSKGTPQDHQVLNLIKMHALSIWYKGTHFQNKYLQDLAEWTCRVLLRGPPWNLFSVGSGGDNEFLSNSPFRDKEKGITMTHFQAQALEGLPQMPHDWNNKANGTHWPCCVRGEEVGSPGTPE